MQTPTFDILDILAVIFGVFYVVRKLDVQRRRAADFPQVAPSDFERWRVQETNAYRLGSWACLLKIVLDPAIWYGLLVGSGSAGASRGPMGLLWGAGAVVDISWLVVMIVAMMRVGRARRLRQGLGIQLGPHTANDEAESPSSAPPDEYSEEENSAAPRRTP